MSDRLIGGANVKKNRIPDIWNADFSDSDRKPTLRALAISIKFSTFVYQVVTSLSFYLDFIKF